MIPTSERLTIIKLTEAEINRVGVVFAYGPCGRKPIDDDLIKAGIFEQYDDMDCVVVTGKGWGDSTNFYNPDGSVRECIRQDARMPLTDSEKYMSVLTDKNNQKMLINVLQNALIGLLRNPNNASAIDLAESAMKKWVDC
jgi:hypothetical protein